MTRDEILRRAARAVAASAQCHAHYKLGAGGRDPLAVSPLEPPDGGSNAGADCSGTVSWILGVPRLNPQIAAQSWGAPRIIAPGHGVGASSLVVTGFTPGRRIEAGEYFRFRGETRIYAVQSNVTATMSGDAVLKVSPKTNRSRAGGDMIEPLGWLETTNVYNDARGPQKLFAMANGMPLPADVIVWPDANGHEGHIGLISAVERGVVTRVIHCASSNAKNLGTAIAETAGIVRPDKTFKPWPEVIRDNKAIVARFRLIEA